MSTQPTSQNGTDEVGKTCEICGEKYIATVWAGPGRKAIRGCGCRVHVVVTSILQAEKCAEASEREVIDA